jgi:hypothetical protein
MVSRKKRLGNGATVSCFVRYLHPSAILRARFLNNYDKERLDGLSVYGREEKTISRRKTDCVLVKHPDFPDQDFYVAKSRVKVQLEGPEDDFFDDPTSELAQNGGNEEATAPEPAPEAQLRFIQREHPGDIVTAELRAQGITVDDDNDPAPENVPAPNAAGPAASSGIFKDTWGFEGCEYRQHMVGRTFQRAALIGVNAECSSLLTPGALLKIFLPVSFIETVIIPQTNLSLNPPLDIDEFFTYLGLWFAMSTCYFSGDRDMFWSSKEITFESGAPYRFHDFMSRNRFNGITQALRFTNIPSPAFRDRFHEVRQLIFEWNVNMENKFSPSWISVIDESMSKWLSEYACPGWMVVP